MESSDNRLAGRIAVVLGGDEPAGREVACAFGQSGAAVVVAGLAMDHGHRTVEFTRALGGEAGFYYGDIRSKASFCDLLDYAVGEYGKVDVVALASLGSDGSVESAGDLREMFGRLGDRLCELEQIARQQEDDVSVIVALPMSGSRAELEIEFRRAVAAIPSDSRLWVNAVGGVALAKDLADKRRLATPFLLLANAVNSQTRGCAIWIGDES